MTTLTTEQRALGRQNASTAVGMTRRDFLKAIPAGAALGAFYFGYKAVERPVRAAIIGTGNEGCQAMIHDHNRDYLDYIGYCDIRPSQQKRAVKEFTAHPQYTPEDVNKLRKYADIDALLADPDVEMLVIALPLWLHAPIAIKSMKAGKHVFCEKLMAHSVGECKAMCRVSHETNRLLAIGHQRHYSVLYDNANYLVSNGQLGEIRHIRALWHRNNGVPRIAKENGKLQYDAHGEPVYVRDEKGNIAYYDSWKPPIPDDDKDVDFAKYGYQSLDELVRWRLYNRTGAGLMAELGSHQLDACSIFLGKKHPLAVTGIGGTFYFTDGREVDDHVFVNFEFPGKSDNDHVVVTYTSINTNAFEKYGEEVMGTRGTMIVESESDMMLFKEGDPNIPKDVGGRTTAITLEKNPAGKPVMETSASPSGPSVAAALGTLATATPSKGYREELEHFCYCVRNGDPSNYHATSDESVIPRCRGEVALGDAVIALTSNLSMRQKRRIEFSAAWFDFESPDVPDGSANDLARLI